MKKFLKIMLIIIGAISLIFVALIGIGLFVDVEYDDHIENGRYTYVPEEENKDNEYVEFTINDYQKIIYVFLTIFLYLLKCPQSLILSALRAFCFCGKPHISRSIFLYFRYQAWLKSW